MQRLILHIGRHKTGTTGVQYSLDLGADALKAVGACYPLTGREALTKRDSVAHHELAMALLAGDAAKLEALQPAFRTEVMGYDTVIVSSEAFQNLSDLSGLKQFFEGFQIRVVCYLREYLAYCASAYAQEIQTSGMIADFSMFARLSQFALMLNTFVARWNAFADETTWRLYERSTLLGGDVTVDFSATIGLPFALPQIEGDTNQSISGNLIAFKLLANMLGFHGWPHPHILGELAAKHRRFAGPFFISSEDQARYRASNSCNDLLRQMFGEVPLADFSNGNPIFDQGYEADFAIIADAYGRAGLDAVANHPMLRPAPT